MPKTMMLIFCLSLAAPAQVLAMGCSDRSHQAQSCASGAVWDSEKQTCVPKPTG